MKLASLKDGSRDGALLVVTRDLTRAAPARAVAPTLQAALDDWDSAEPALRALARDLEAGTAPGIFPFEPRDVLAPLARAHQFVDASAFLNHGNIMCQAFPTAKKPDTVIPILVQRQGDDFRGPHDDYEIRSEADQGDFEGEIGAILGDVPMGVDAREAERHIRLFVLLNDMSLRAHITREIGMGFGLINGKSATVFGPVAVTPDELGPAWANGRVNLPMRVEWNGRWFGHPNGSAMSFTFGALIAHLAATRRLRAGTILGTGTFSDENHHEVGSACLAERVMLDIIETGAVKTPWLRYGDRLRFDVSGPDGRSVFGAIAHKIVPPEVYKPDIRG